MSKIFPLLFGVCLVAITGCGRRKDAIPGEPPVAVRVGAGREAVSGLAILADSRKLFRKENLAASVTYYPSGKLALEALLRGEVDLATVAQTPIVLESFRRRDLRILAVIGSSDNEMRMVARKDLGVMAPADLRGKRIGTQSHSSMHFFLHLFLLKQGLTVEDVKVKFVAPDALTGLLERGEVQAVSLREPLIGVAMAKLGSKAVVFAEPGLCVRFYCLVTTDRMLLEKPKAVAGVLRALLEGDRLARVEPETVRAGLANALGISPASAHALWPSIDLRICLPQALLLSLEDEARWAMSENLTEGRSMPNYLDFLDMAPLLAERPDVVTVIH